MSDQKVTVMGTETCAITLLRWRINPMQTQIKLYKAQLRWEPWKALAAMVVAAAIFAGSVLALSNWLHPPGSQASLAPPAFAGVPQVIFQPGAIQVLPAAPAQAPPK